MEILLASSSAFNERRSLAEGSIQSFESQHEPTTQHQPQLTPAPGNNISDVHEPVRLNPDLRLEPARLVSRDG